VPHLSPAGHETCDLTSAAGSRETYR